MNAPLTDLLTVVRGHPTPEEIAALLVALAALRPGPDEPDPPRTKHRWGPPTAWHRPQPVTAPDAYGWQRTPTHERSPR